MARRWLWLSSGNGSSLSTTWACPLPSRPPPGGSTVQVGKGQRALLRLSLLLIYFILMTRFVFFCALKEVTSVEQGRRPQLRRGWLSVAGSLGRGQLACPCFLRPRPGPPQLGSAVPSHRPGTTACLTEAGRCVSGVLPLLQLFVGEPRGALSMWPKPRFGSQWGGETSAPAPASSAQPPGAQGLLRGLRKRHLPSARSCQVFFKGLQVSRDQTDVKISLESQIYP